MSSGAPCTLRVRCACGCVSGSHSEEGPPCTLTGLGTSSDAARVLVGAGPLRLERLTQRSVLRNAAFAQEEVPPQAAFLLHP